MGVFIAPNKFCPLAAGKVRNDLSVDHPVDWPTVIFYNRCATGRPGLEPESDGSLAGRPPGRSELDTESNSSLPGRPPNRPELDTESSSSLPVDQGHFQRAELSGRSTARSTHGCVHVLCTSVDRTGRPTSASVDRSGRPADSQVNLFRD